MKRHLTLILFCIFLGGAAGALASGETVFVNLDTLYRNYYKTKLAYTELNAEGERIKADNESVLKEFEALKEAYAQLRAESQDGVLGDEMRASKRNEAEECLIDLQNKAKELREAEARAGEQLKKRKSGMDKRILEQIRDAIKVEAQTKGYLCVHNVQNIGATALQGVLSIPYYDADAEITEDILKRLNKGFVEDSVEETTDGAE